MLLRTTLLCLSLCAALPAQKPFCDKDDIFPLDAKHNHASAMIRLPEARHEPSSGLARSGPP